MDWQFKHLAQRCYGNEEQAAAVGTSAYMLFYERVKKKDIRIVLDDARVEERRNNNVSFKEYLESIKNSELGELDNKYNARKLQKEAERAEQDKEEEPSEDPVDLN